MSNIFVEKPFQKNFTTHYDKETGISTVTYTNEYGKFTGKAKLHPNDTESRFSGYHIAESRADIQYYHTMMEYWKGRIAGINHLEMELFDLMTTQYGEKTNEEASAVVNPTNISFIGAATNNALKQAIQQKNYYREMKNKEIKYLKAYLDKIDKRQDNL